MRIIVFGCQRTIRKMMSLTGKEGEVEVVNTLAELNTMMTLPKQDSVDLAIVDSTAEDTEAACRHIIKFWDIPLVLIVGRRQADWKTLRSLGADGYLPDEAENAELAARLRAILRRTSPARPSEQVNYLTTASSIPEPMVS